MSNSTHNAHSYKQKYLYLCCEQNKIIQTEKKRKRYNTYLPLIGTHLYMTANDVVESVMVWVQRVCVCVCWPCFAFFTIHIHLFTYGFVHLQYCKNRTNRTYRIFRMLFITIYLNIIYSVFTCFSYFFSSMSAIVIAWC